MYRGKYLEDVLYDNVMVENITKSTQFAEKKDGATGITARRNHDEMTSPLYSEEAIDRKTECLCICEIDGKPLYGYCQ